MINRLATAVMGLALSCSAIAYPDKAITYVIPFGPGGESDVTAQFQKPFLESVLGQDVKFKYVPGAGGAKGWSMLNRFPGDGHTIVNVNLPHIVVQPSLNKVGYETNDINPVYFFHYTPDAVLVKKDSPYNTLADLITAARNAPGTINFSGSGKNSANHIIQQVFDDKAAIQTNYVAYKGSSAAAVALLGGQVDAMWGYTTAGIKYSDNVRVLAVGTEERHPALPDAPTLKELGYDWTGGAFRGIAVPKSTPAEVVKQLSDHIDTVNKDPEFIKMMTEAGFAVINVDSDQMKEFMEEKKARYTSILIELSESD